MNEKEMEACFLVPVLHVAASEQTYVSNVFVVLLSNSLKNKRGGEGREDIKIS